MSPDSIGRVGGLEGSPQIVLVAIKQSKTDPSKQGATISLGKLGNDFARSRRCWRNFSEKRIVTAKGIFSDGSSLSRQRLVSCLRESLLVLGPNCELYSGHMQFLH